MLATERFFPYGTDSEYFRKLSTRTYSYSMGSNISNSSIGKAEIIQKMIDAIDYNTAHEIFNENVSTLLRHQDYFFIHKDTPNGFKIAIIFLFSKENPNTEITNENLNTFYTKSIKPHISEVLEKIKSENTFSQQKTEPDFSSIIDEINTINEIEKVYLAKLSILKKFDKFKGYEDLEIEFSFFNLNNRKLNKIIEYLDIEKITQILHQKNTIIGRLSKENIEKIFSTISPKLMNKILLSQDIDLDITKIFPIRKNNSEGNAPIIRKYFDFICLLLIEINNIIESDSIQKYSIQRNSISKIFDYFEKVLATKDISQENLIKSSEGNYFYSGVATTHGRFPIMKLFKTQCFDNKGYFKEISRNKNEHDYKLITLASINTHIRLISARLEAIIIHIHQLLSSDMEYFFPIKNRTKYTEYLTYYATYKFIKYHNIENINTELLIFIRTLFLQHDIRMDELYRDEKKTNIRKLRIDARFPEELALNSSFGENPNLVNLLTTLISLNSPDTAH
jgi:hypothetical protein